MRTWLEQVYYNIAQERRSTHRKMPKMRTSGSKVIPNPSGPHWAWLGFNLKSRLAWFINRRWSTGWCAGVQASSSVSKDQQHKQEIQYSRLLRDIHDSGLPERLTFCDQFGTVWITEDSAHVWRILSGDSSVYCLLYDYINPQKTTRDPLYPLFFKKQD